MKYDTNLNKPLICMQTQSTCYKGTTTMTVKGILWHSTGANNPLLRRYVQPSDIKPSSDTYDKETWLEILGKNKYNNDWNHIERQAGLNAWIGQLDNKTVASIQTMPWNYRPWGCGTGKYGSCNDGFIQFEICEDSLSDQSYFESIYKEACELTAYLCKLFNIDPKGMTEVGGQTIPTIICHADSYKLGLGSNHSDIYHWFSKYDKTMEDVREDVANLLNDSIPVQPEEKPEEQELYRVRKSWDDPQSQIGAYSILDNAIKVCDKAGNDIYEVYNAKGEAIYPERVQLPEEEPIKENTFALGDEVKLIAGATYANGKSVPAWVFKKKLYVRQVSSNGNITISTVKIGAITGVVKPESLIPYSEELPEEAPKFEPYLVKVTGGIISVRSGPGNGYKINTQIKKNGVYTIVEEKNDWGKLKSGAGWIPLNYTKKL